MLTVGLLFLVAYLLRGVPLWLAPQGAGVDHWFWKKYIETYRRERRFPPHLPQYLLDEAQWYPPVFPLLMARLPMALFDRWSQQLAIAVDLLRMGLLLAITARETDGTAPLIVAGLMYATTPIQISYNIQLNPRGLGALLLDALLLMLLWTFAQGGAWWGWVVIVALGAVILLTHKMTTQLFWFIVLGTAVIYRRWELLLLIPASMLAALAMSGGFYRKVLVAHWDIVSFWNSNWRWIGADQVRESPLYGDGRYERRQKLHRGGAGGFLWHCVVLFGFNPAAWISCLLVYERLFSRSALLIYPTPYLVWLLLPCLFACLTTFVPRLKCLGAGYLYLYNTSMLSSLILALTYQYTRAPRLSTALVALALTLNVLGAIAYYRQFAKSKRSRVDEELHEMVEALRQRPLGTVMCMPVQWSEVVAYRTAQPVLWGGHGYGFRRLQPTWPRLLIPIRDVIARYDVRYLLTMDSMLTPELEADLPAGTVVRSGEYRLYAFESDGSGARSRNDGSASAGVEEAGAG